MSDKKQNEKELLLKILREELEREEYIKKLAEELDEIERGETRDYKRIVEIVNELKIMNPYPEEDDEIIEISPNTKRIKRQRRIITLRISAACIIILLGIQIISFAAFGINLFDWTKNSFLNLIGVEIQQDDTSFLSSEAKEYKTIEEFELAENIDIIVPNWLPENIEIIKISYSYNYSKKEVDILYKSDSISLSIKLDNPLPDVTGTEIYENNNNLFYIFPESSVILWEYNGNYYTLTFGFDITEYAEKIIKNIK